MNFEEWWSNEAAVTLREVYGLPPDAEIWMRPDELVSWYDEWLKDARRRMLNRQVIQQ